MSTPERGDSLPRPSERGGLERRRRALGARGDRGAVPRPGLGLTLFALLVALGVAGAAAASGLAYRAIERRALDAAQGRATRGLTTIQRVMDERLRRMGDQAQLLAQQPALIDAFVNRDQAQLNDLLNAARTQGTQAAGLATAIAVVDGLGRAVAEQPPRAVYDYSQMGLVRAALNPSNATVQRRGLEMRPTAANPLSDLGQTAVFPILVENRPAGAVVLMRALNDGYMAELAVITGLDVGVVTSESLVAGSPRLRDLFTPPNVRPAGQRIAPVWPIHEIGSQRYVATSDALRVTMPLPNPVPPLPGGLPGAERVNAGGGNPNTQINVATLFVGLRAADALGDLPAIRQQLAGVAAGGALAAAAAALLLARWLGRPLADLRRGLQALAAGEEHPQVATGGARETARAAGAFNAASDAITSRVQTLRDELRKLEAVIDSVAEGIVVLDDSARLVSANEAAQRLLGLPGVPAGADLQALLTTGQWQALREALLRRDRFTAEVSLDEPRQAIVRVAAVPVHDDFARPLGRAIVLQDVTEERLLDNVKADFFTAMSHELRTPLSAIKGAAELLLDDELPATQQHFVQTIHRNADRLGRLVTDLLDLSKLESGRTELRLGRVDLTEIAGDVVSALQPVAERSLQRLLLETPDSPLTLIGDHGRIEQVVTNLVSNACQYTPEGGTIAVRTWRDGSLACLSVTDDGIGISTVDQQHLFDKFYQGVSALTRKRGGSGLGLTIVKHLTELHGGTIGVRSKLGRGSTFTIRLPAASAGPLALAGSPSAGGAAAHLPAAEQRPAPKETPAAGSGSSTTPR